MSALGIALLSIGLFVVGGGIGFYLARLGQAANSARLDEVETEYDDYRRQVTEHFSKTAEQIHTIGLQYRDLYEHLATGSEALCKLESPTAEPPFPLVRQDATDRPEADEPVAEEVLVAAAAVTTAAADEADEPAEPVDSQELPEAEGKVVADADAEVELVAEASDQEAADADEADDAVEAAGDETPDNVVELMPRDDADDSDTDGERSIR